MTSLLLCQRSVMADSCYASLLLWQSHVMILFCYDKSKFSVMAVSWHGISSLLWQSPVMAGTCCGSLLLCHSLFCQSPVMVVSYYSGLVMAVFCYASQSPVMPLVCYI